MTGRDNIADVLYIAFEHTLWDQHGEMILSLLLLVLASATDTRANSVPPDMQGIWGWHGRCDVAADRLTITQSSARWGKAPFMPVTFEAETQSINWMDEGAVDNFVRGKTGNVIVHNVQGFGMPGAQGYARCTDGLRRVAWPAKNPAPREAKAVAFRLYYEVRRLNARCEASGGGVSGSPDCDESIARESMLEHLGYCIDYTHGEKLVRCDKVRRSPSITAAILPFSRAVWTSR